MNFLLMQEQDPRQKFIKSLLNKTKKPGDILVYNMTFEKTRLSELARDFSDYAIAIEERISRIKDLMIPFQKKYYYTSEMNGSYSIKSVLPALVPELDYSDLDISDGGTAMNAYEHLQQETDKKNIKKIKKNLLEYCKMDTLAMVKILEKLNDVVSC